MARSCAFGPSQTLTYAFLPLADFLYLVLAMSIIAFNECLSPSSGLSNPRMIMGILEFIASWFEVMVVLGTHKLVAYV